MKLSHRIVATTLTSAALFGLFGAGLAAADEAAVKSDATVTIDMPVTSASPAGDDMSIESTTRRFTMQNLSGYTLRLANYSSDAIKDNNELPKAGTLIEPGHDLPMEATYYFLADNRFMVTVEVLNDKGSVIGHMTVRFKLDGFSNPTTDSPTQVGPVVVDTDGYGITFTNRDVSTTTIDSDQPELQNEILNNYCREGSKISCTFDLKSKDENAFGQKHPVGQVIENGTNKDGDLTVSMKDAVATTNAFSISSTIKENVLDIVDVSLTATAQHSVVRTHEYTVTTKLIAEAHTRTWVEASEPVIRYTGDFTITAGNSTWILKNVAIDTPDPSDNRVPVVSWKSSPLTSQQLATAADTIDLTDIPASTMVG